MSPTPLSGATSTPTPRQAVLLAAVQETLQGNVNAFRIIVDEYTPLLFSLAVRMTGSREDAEEAVQEIFLKVYSALPSFKIEKRFHPWLYAIALNFLKSFFKRKQRRRIRESIFPTGVTADLYADEKGDDPGRRLELAQAEEDAGKALLELRHEHRAVFILRAVENLPFAEIAQMLDIPEGTAKTYFHRAKTSLAKKVFNAFAETRPPRRSMD